MQNHADMIQHWMHYFFPSPLSCGELCRNQSHTDEQKDDRDAPPWIQSVLDFFWHFGTSLWLKISGPFRFHMCSYVINLGVSWCFKPTSEAQGPLLVPFWSPSRPEQLEAMKPARHMALAGRSLRAGLLVPRARHTARRTFYEEPLFPTCQVRVVRFYVSCLVLLLLLSSPPPLVVLLLSLSSSSSCSTATRDPQCSLSDLNHDHPCSVFPAGPQPRVSMPSVPCRTSTMTIHAQCSLPDLNHDHPRPVFPAGPQPRPSTPSVPCRTSTASIHAKRYAT